MSRSSASTRRLRYYPPDWWAPPAEWVARLLDEYTGQHGGDTETLPAGSDPDRVVAAVLTLNEEESVKVLRAVIADHHQDYTFDRVQMNRLKELVEGHEACEMEYGEWSYSVAKMAGYMQNWSPYAEVRAVTLPYDDPEELSSGYAFALPSTLSSTQDSQAYPFPASWSSCF